MARHSTIQIMELYLAVLDLDKTQEINDLILFGDCQNTKEKSNLGQ